MDLTATTPFDLVILDTAASCFASSRKKKKTGNSSSANQVFAFTTGSSSSEGFSSNSSNGSFGTSPTPLQVRLQSSAICPAAKGSRSSQLLPPPSARLQKSSSEMSVKQLGQRDNSEFWLRVVPSCKVRPRECDEVPEEFKRAGIGLCFGGEIYVCLHY